MTEQQPKKISIGAYIALIFAIIFFSGITVSKPVQNVATQFANSIHVAPEKVHNILKVLDFNTLNGSFGDVTAAVTAEKAPAKTTFRGKDGTGARDGFLFAFSLIPTTLFAMGMVAVLEFYGALDAMRQLFSKILRPLLGIPGEAGLALIASLQSTDAGAALTRALYDEKKITQHEREIFSMFQFSAGATITNFLGSGAALLALTAASGEKVPASIGLCFAVMFIFKIVGANLMRFYLKLSDRKVAADGAPVADDSADKTTTKEEQ
ncbi:nucleoside recognition domain-containing protein [Dichelobacter nodosus]|uniref:Nucleoside transporter/FeoB GTPase Gate domain-containing protein n=1 Tax=Dichelobacter nodosus (strain VCS1703A) TaxID=246195 RepID=A5EV54_DICNV|nr:nucleoside recognition domain-containing protein [Dichelobacter nodosus]ABQ14335.1 conserved hypothetical protein [Dichelobacter nodosus VCS1703A]KNZ38957.1 membrane protein [Dichelobacter nodosus]TGA66244.1 YjiH family protein [Dichelobacter nodosus]